MGWQHMGCLPRGTQRQCSAQAGQLPVPETCLGQGPWGTQAGRDGPGWCPRQLCSVCCGWCLCCLQAPRSLSQTAWQQQQQQQAALHWVLGRSRQHVWLLETAAPHLLESAAWLQVSAGPEGWQGQPAQGALRD